MDMINPAAGGYAVTPNDTTDLPNGVCSCLYVGTQGDLEVVMRDGMTLVFASAVGWMPIQASRVKSANTSAQDIIACYGSP